MAEKYKGNGFLYETHLHTSEVSKCAQASAAEQMRYYKSMGFAGVCVTDHFFNGNTVVSKNLPWTKRVERFCEGYERALEEGEKIGLQVFFGWEYSYSGNDFLTYGLDGQWLLDHPECLRLALPRYCDFVRKQGGLVIHAHPFREDSYIDMIRLLPRRVDGVEVMNANRRDFENRLADQYADNYGLLKIAGSDNHTGMQQRLGGIVSKTKLASVQEMIDAIRQQEVTLVTL